MFGVDVPMSARELIRLLEAVGSILLASGRIQRASDLQLKPEQRDGLLLQNRSKIAIND